ncbi:S9 family peptidase [Halegenticoccus soli]|uniref:S9 family peptidase n=1 Tax=Halegenticoccus soli TaxID=1985678 RepID=UPI000C6DB33D|nr:S9 family peptidase [Halegenticoccus soli]
MTEPIPLDALCDLTRITEIALSPDGGRLAFCAAEADPDEDEFVPSLFVVPTDGGREPHRLTRLPGASSPRWSPDGDRLAFLAAREEDTERRVGRETDEAEAGDDEDRSDRKEGENGDEDRNGEEDENGSENGGDGGDGDEPKAQVWLFDLDLGGDARQVTDREEGVSEFDWGPDGERIAIAARDPTDEEREYLKERRDGGPIETERLQHKLDGAGWLDAVTAYLFVVDLDSGEETRLDDAYGGGAFEPLSGMDPSWGADGRIAFTSCRTENPDDTLVRDLYAIRPDGSDLTKLTDSDLAVGFPRWSPDGTRLAFVGRDPENWCIPAQVYLHDGAGYESLTADLDRTLAWSARPVWEDDETLYALAADEGRTRLIRVGVDGSVDRVFEAQGDDRAMQGFDLRGGTAATTFSHPTDGHDAFAVDAADLDAEAEPPSLRRLTAVNDDFTNECAMPACRRFSYESSGWEIDGLLYHPPEFDPDDPVPRPLVVAIHGGPISYDEPVFDFSHAALVSRGYVIFRPNYRGGSSYGREFAETLRGRWGTVEVEDVVAGIESAVDRGWADPDRVFGYGFSYGGIAQGYLVTQTDALAAAAPEHGIYDLRSAFGTDDSHVWTENEYGLPWENQGAFDASSSITDVGNVRTPLLVMAGGRDWRCPPSQSEQLYVSARKQGVDAKLVVYPDEHHDIGTPERAIHRLEQITAWYERHDPASEDDDAR